MSQIKHVAIIMDGNGRWAKQRFRPRIWGHVRGSRKVSDVVKAACELKLSSLTLYAFSTENWSRPKDEVKGLFKLLDKFLQKEKQTIIEENIQFEVLGDYSVLDQGVIDKIEALRSETKDNTGLLLNLAINYGGRAEIVAAVNQFIHDNPNQKITEKDITRNLYNNQCPEIDLLIRTSGDQRISNFLLWQLSYSELYFTKTKWPEFTSQQFKKIIADVSKRERRFGGVRDDIGLDQNKSTINEKQKVVSEI